MLSDTVLLHVWWNGSFVNVRYVADFYHTFAFHQSEISAQTHEYLSRLSMTATPLNIRHRLQVKALLSVTFTITGRAFFVLFWEREAHRATPCILQSLEFISKILYYLRKLLDCILKDIKFLHATELDGKHLGRSFKYFLNYYTSVYS